MDGYVSNLVVDGVDVTEFVDAELDGRHLERVQLREVRTADDSRAMRDTVEKRWADTVVRAQWLPEPALHDRVGGEWSFVETLRHLLFITDSWASRTVLDEPMPYHRLGLPQTTYRPADATALGVDPDARPSLAEVLAVRAARMALVRRIVDGALRRRAGTDLHPGAGPGHPEEAWPVGECLGVVMEEECEHHLFAMGDLALLEAGAER